MKVRIYYKIQIQKQLRYKFDNFKAVRWIMQNREDTDILVHPNTGYEIQDHSDWAFT
jgi:aromatic ring-cleaving dioxygenase